MRILIDCDGVLCDFVGRVIAGIHQHSHKHRERNVGPADVYQWDIWKALDVDLGTKRMVISEIICAEGFCRDLLPYEGATQAVKQLAKDHDVYFCTSDWRTSPTWVYDRNEWLRNYFGFTLGGKVVHTSHKHLVKGDVLIDDKPDNLTVWGTAHGTEGALLWQRPWNVSEAKAFHTVTSWDGVAAHLIDMNPF